VTEELGSRIPTWELYTEKVHIYEKGVLREIIVFIYRGMMNFMFLERAISFICPIDVCNDIDEILYCDMKHEKDPKF
jgi:hypothetical protein